MKRLVIFILFSCNMLVGQGNVGIGTATPNPSAKLDIESQTQGFLPPRMTTAQRDAIVNPEEGLMIFNTITKCMEYFNSIQWVSNCQPTTTVCYQNCNSILLANPSSLDGVYTIDLDCAGPLAPMQCYCDMTTDGGGWTMVLNYLHLGGTNPLLTVRTVDLPLLGSTTLGVNENGTSYWGHASSSLMNAITFTSVRFYGKTTNHARVIHFKTTHANTISYFKTGVGSSNGIGAAFTALAGHSAFLPASSNLYFPNRGDASMPEFPYYLGNTYHWGIGGLGNRWEVDDYPNNFNFSTYHQIWVR